MVDCYVNDLRFICLKLRKNSLNSIGSFDYNCFRLCLKYFTCTKSNKSRYGMNLHVTKFI